MKQASLGSNSLQIHSHHKNVPLKRLLPYAPSTVVILIMPERVNEEFNKVTAKRFLA